jgi:hypothetical protein
VLSLKDLVRRMEATARGAEAMNVMDEAMKIKSNMNEATERRMKEAVNRVMELLIDELEIEVFSMRLEPDENAFTVVDVLMNAIELAVAIGIFERANLPPPPATEIYELCAKVFLEKAAH